jgi:hypothetical protein
MQHTPTDVRGDVLPTVPGLRSVLRASTSDFYYNSWRLVPANAVWALCLLAAWLAWPIWILASLAFLLLSVLPATGVFRLACLITRGETVSLGEAFGAWRQSGAAGIAIGLLTAAAVTILGTNLVGGIEAGDPIGAGFATLAAWGLILCWLATWVAWPLLTDPRREGRRLGDTLRLTGYVVLAGGRALAALGIVLAAILAISVVATPAIILMSFAYSALAAARFGLPLADRVEARLGQRGIALAVSDPGRSGNPSGG